MTSRALGVSGGWSVRSAVFFCPGWMELVGVQSERYGRTGIMLVALTTRRRILMYGGVLARCVCV
jgi:hypothetical protein